MDNSQPHPALKAYYERRQAHVEQMEALTMHRDAGLSVDERRRARNKRKGGK